MKNPLIKIGFILLVTILIPVLFFSVYEIGTLQENENIIETIYEKQLKSILYSINQYSEDNASNWANEMSMYSSLNKKSSFDKIDKFIGENLAVECIFYADKQLDELNIYFGDSEENNPVLKEKILLILITNKEKINRLDNYLAAGYRKIESFNLKKERSIFLFMTDTISSNSNLCGIVINSEVFIQENLGPKIQQVSQDEFFISIFDITSQTEIYSNRNQQDINFDNMQKSPMWLLSNYEMGIDLRGETINDLVRNRANRNLILIVIIDILLIIGAWIIYSNFRREIKLVQMKSEFISNVSHEIRTPLSLISMYSETLEMGRIENENKKKEYYKVISQETQRLSEMVNRILNFSKIEKNKKEYHLTKNDLNALLEKILESLEKHIINKGFKLSRSYGNNIPHILLDKNAIEEALLNLLDNAMKYSSDKKTVELKTGVENNQVYIQIKDYGIGIHEKEQKLIFDRFYRVTDGNLANKIKGTGMGLSIVKHIMEAHKGTITLQSSPGKGSSFRLNFPAT